MRHRTRIIALGWIVLLLGGCGGYGLVGRTSSLPPDIEKIFIPQLQNRTLRQQLEQTMTRAITDEFLRRPRYKLVNSKAESDAYLDGTITSFRIRPVTFGAQEGRGREYEIQITAQMAFRRTETEEELWRQDLYQFRSSYEISEDEVDFIDLEDVAIAEIARQFAQTLVIDILEGF